MQVSLSELHGTATMNPAWMSFFTGLLIGGCASLVGAALSYWFGLRDRKPQSGAPLAYLFLVPVVLSLIGALAVVFSLLNGGSVSLTLITGLGVIVGFTLVFALLLFLWVQAESSS